MLVGGEDERLKSGENGIVMLRVGECDGGVLLVFNVVKVNLFSILTLNVRP